MTFGEAWRLTGVLAADTSSQVCAAVNGWEYPAGRDALVLMDFYDLFHQSKARRTPRPYPRPFPNGNRQRFGRSRFTPEETRAILAAHGPRK